MMQAKLLMICRLKINGTGLVVFLIALANIACPVKAQNKSPYLKYTVSMPQPSAHYFHVRIDGSGWHKDTLEFKMPKWMPGYYQIMDYAKAAEHVSAKNSEGKILPVKNINENSWQIVAAKNKPFVLNYDVKADRQFVANSYVDSAHGYIVPCGAFLYINGYVQTPVSIKVRVINPWAKVATGLDPVTGKKNEFSATGFDILYDCPILAGNLQELPSFNINGKAHRFIGYRLEDFDQAQFMANLKKVVEAAAAIIGDIPYNQYTFIGIGPGRGGIEHLNNTTVSFDGKGLNTSEGLKRIMNFLAHEYFHHYNVKRIRPIELGPFDYDNPTRTNLLWVSEGLSVYYEYMIVKRAGLISEQTLFANFENSINNFESSPGRLHQSLTQASYDTWSEGPYGKQAADTNLSISYYDKGPAVGLLLDFAIRHATQNKKSLDDVMRLLYCKYYKEMNRGFTDAEFQQVCETIAGISLSNLFEYVYTTKELDYKTYFAYAGLSAQIQIDNENRRRVSLKRMENADELQSAILKSWLRELNTKKCYLLNAALSVCV